MKEEGKLRTGHRSNQLWSFFRQLAIPASIALSPERRGRDGLQLDTAIAQRGAFRDDSTRTRILAHSRALYTNQTSRESGMC